MFKPALIATLFLGPALAAGCGGPRHHGPIDQARMDRQITEHLDDYLDDAKASDAQRARIAAVKQQLLPQGVALANAQQQVNRELAQQLASDKPDRTRLHALVDQQAEATRAFAHKAIDGLLEAHGTLSTEQRAPLTRKLQRFASR
jgi:Spy/CpxP family protein refolding chaperone